jgi:hypothetical protein
MDNQIKENTQNFSTIPLFVKYRAPFLILMTVLLILLCFLSLYFLFSNQIRKQELISPPDTLPTTPASQVVNPTGLLMLKSRERTTRIIKPQIDPHAIDRQKPQSFKIFMPQVLAEVSESSTVNLYRINSLIPNLAKAKLLAQKYGFNEEPEEPDSYGRPITFRWANQDSSLVIDQRVYYYDFVSKQGDLPTPGEAVLTATQFLKDRNLYSADIVGHTTEKQKIELFYDFYNKNHPRYNTKTDAIAVNFLKQKDGLPIVFGDIGGEESTDLVVFVGPGNEVVRVSDTGYGFQINEQDFLQAQQKDVTGAINEYMDTGGAVRWISPLPGKGWSSSGKYEIRDSVVTKIYKAYYLDNLLGMQYPEDLTLRNTSYLLPIWVFIGNGKIFGGEYTGEEIKFVSVIYAFKELKGEAGPFSIQSLDINKEEVTPGSTISASFNFSYNSLLSPQYRSYRPRQGLKFKTEVVYPNRQNIEAIDLIRDPNYGELAQINVGDQQGDLIIRVSLVDFPSVALEKVVKITALAIDKGNEILKGGVYVSSTGEPIVCGLIILKKISTGGEFTTHCDSKGEFRIEGLSTGGYSITAKATDGAVLQSQAIEILNHLQNLNRFNRVENYINIDVATK